jgi:hypothetical protein
LVPRLLPGERAAADLGYSDGWKNFVTAFPRDGATNTQISINRDLKLMGARHESVNQRFKSFECLNTRIFRHGRQFHHVVFAAVANLVQVNLQDEPLWDFTPSYFRN